MERRTDLCNAKELDGRLASIQRTLLSLNLLEAKIIPRRVKVIQGRSRPFLIRLRVLLLQTADILGQLLQDLLLELALRLTRAQLAIGTG